MDPLKIAPLVTAALLAAVLAGCASPEERVDDFVSRARQYLDEGRPELADVELRNALRLAPDDPDVLFVQAQLLEERQAWNALRETLRRVLETSPDRLDATLMLGRLLVAAGDRAEAEPLVQRALALAPESAEAQLLHATLLARSDDAQGARTAARKVLALDAGQADAWALLADLDWRAGAYDEALEHVRRGLEAQADSVPLHRIEVLVHLSRGEPEEAAAALRELVGHYPRELAYRQELALLHARGGEPERAEAVLREAVRDLPSNPEARLLLARFLAEQDPARAIEELRGYIARGDDPDGLMTFQLGSLHEARGDVEAAESVYAAIIARNPEEVGALRARNELARIALAADRQAEAERLTEEVLAIDPEDPDALLLRAYLQLQENEINQAIVTLRTVLRARQDSDRALHLLGRAYQLQGSPDLAEESFLRALDVNPYHLESARQLVQRWLAEGDLERAADLLTPIVEAGRADEALVRALLRIKLASGEYDEAELLAQEAAAALDAPALAAYVRALSRLDQNDPEGAIAAFEAALEKSPEATAVLRGLVETEAELGRRPAAIRRLQRHLETHPDHLAARDLLARQQAAGGDWAAAERTLEGTIERAPEALEAYASLAQGHLERGNRDAAVDAYERAVTAQPRAIRLRLALASLYTQQGRRADAEREYRAILELRPGTDPAANNLAVLLSEDPARLDEAYELVRHFEDADQPSYLDTVGWIQVLRGEYARAAALLRQAHEAAPEVQEIRYHLGVALARQGRAGEARPYLETAAADGDASHAREARRELAALDP